MRQRPTSEKLRRPIIQNQIPPQNEPKPSTARGSKRAGSNSGEGPKKRRAYKKIQAAEDKDNDRDEPEECAQDPFEMIEIEESRIKDELFETEELNAEIKSERIVETEGGPSQEKGQFETVFVNPDTIKREQPDEVISPDNFYEEETISLNPVFEQTEIKLEPPEEVENEDDEEEEEHPTACVVPPLLWRCPLVSCPELFSTELEMYQHLNLNHVVKGLALSSKSKKVAGPRSTTTEELSSKPTVISPSAPPSVAISGASGLVFFTAASTSHVPPLGISTVTTPITTSQPVPSSSSGPVTVTTTFSYSSISTASAPVVVAVSNSCLSSVSSATPISSATLAVPIASTSTDFTSCSPTVVPVSVSAATECSAPPIIAASTNPNSSSLHSPSSQALNKIIVAPIGEQTSSSTEPKKCLLLAALKKPQPTSTVKPSQPIKVYQPPQSTTEELPPCATDESEMFSISLARFPTNKRIPIKKKLLDVVDCIKNKNVNPEKLIIAYYENSFDSRTM